MFIVNLLHFVKHSLFFHFLLEKGSLSFVFLLFSTLFLIDLLHSFFDLLLEFLFSLLLLFFAFFFQFFLLLSPNLFLLL